MNTRKIKVGAVIFVLAVIVLTAAIRPKYGGSLDLLTPVARLSLEAIETKYPTLLYNQFIACQGDIFESDYFAAIDINSTDNLITLRAAGNQFFSDGRPLTPEYLYSFLREADEMKRLAAMLSRQSGAKVSFLLSGDTIRIGLNGITPFMLLTLYSGIPYKPATPNTYTGPFYPYIVDNNRIKLRANKFFPGGRPYLDEISIRRTENARLLPALIAEDAGGASVRLTESRYSELLKGGFRRFHSIESFYLVFDEEFDTGSILDVTVTIDAADFIHGLTGGFGREFRLTADSENDETSVDYISRQTTRNIFLQYRNDPFHSNVALRVKRVLEEKGYHVQTRIRGKGALDKSEGGIIYLFSNITESRRKKDMSALKAQIFQSLGLNGLYLKEITGCGDAKSAALAIERLERERRIAPLFEIDNYLLFTPNVKGISTWADLWLYSEGERVGN